MEHPQGAGLGVGTTWMSVSMDEGGALIAQLRAIGRSASSHVAAALKLQVLHLREKREAKERLRRLRRLLKTAECEQPGQEEAQQELLGGLCPFRAMTKGILRCSAAVSRSTFVFIAGTTLIM